MAKEKTKSFAEFLAEQAERLREKHAERDERRRGYIQSVHRLLQQMKKWIAEVDEHKVLSLEDSGAWVTDEFGRFQVPSLVITLDSKQVSIVPVGRNVVAPGLASLLIPRNKKAWEVKPQGRVDILSNDQRIKLYCYRAEDNDHWLLLDDQTGRFVELTKNAFECLLMNMLQ